MNFGIIYCAGGSTIVLNVYLWRMNRQTCAFVQFERFVRHVRKFAEMTYLRHVRLSAWNNSVSGGRIVMKFNIWVCVYLSVWMCALMRTWLCMHVLICLCMWASKIIHMYICKYCNWKSNAYLHTQEFVSSQNYFSVLSLLSQRKIWKKLLHFKYFRGQNNPLSRLTGWALRSKTHAVMMRAWAWK